MSYARFGKNSAVYVYSDGFNYICCACRMCPKLGWFEPWRTRSLLELREHLTQHDEVGQRIPKHAWVRINVEIAEKREIGGSTPGGGPKRLTSGERMLAEMARS